MLCKLDRVLFQIVEGVAQGLHAWHGVGVDVLWLDFFPAVMFLTQVGVDVGKLVALFLDLHGIQVLVYAHCHKGIFYLTLHCHGSSLEGPLGNVAFASTLFGFHT